MKSMSYTSVMGFEWDTDFANEIKDLAVVSDPTYRVTP